MSAAGAMPAAAAGLDRRQLLLGAALLGLTGAALALKPRRTIAALPEGALERLVPRTIGPWRYLTASGLVLPPQDELSAQLYDQVLTRVYERPDGATLALLIAYGSAQNASLQLHRPENCYPAQGFTLSDRRVVPLRLGRAEANACLITAERAATIDRILYWTRIDRSFTIDGPGDRRAIVAANLRGYLPDGVLVRLSTHAPEPDAAAAVLRDFNGRMLAALGGEGRRLLLGAAA